MGKEQEEPQLQLTVGINPAGRVCLDFHGASISHIELGPAVAIEIANALIGNAFMVINTRKNTPESKELNNERKADERPN